MANTYVDYTGDGNTTSFAYTFAVLSGQQENHIIVGVDDSTTTGGKFEVVDPADYTIDASAGTITFDTAPESGARIRIRRDSDASTLLVDFKNGTVLPERDLDLAYVHNLYLNEEIEEGSGRQVLTKNDDGNYDGDSVKLVNLAEPENAQDAATKGSSEAYVDSQIAALVFTGTPGGQIDTVNIADGAITTDKIEDVAVTTAKIENGSVTAAKISTTDDKFNVQSNGNVGIGTASPSKLLHVEGTTQQIYAQIGDSDNNSFSSPQVVLQLDGDSLATGAGPGLQFNSGVTCAELYGVRASGGAGGDFFIKTRTYDAVTDTSSLVEYFRIKEDGKVGINTDAPTSTLHVNGSLSKSSGSFKIKHPLKPDTHELVHSFVEAPQADNIYRGKVNLQNGIAKVNIDTVAGMTEGTFAALNREVQVFTSNESDWDAVKGNVAGNILTINCQNATSTATISWLVIGERQDAHMYDTEWTDENGKVIVEPLAE